MVAQNGLEMIHGFGFLGDLKNDIDRTRLSEAY